MKNNYYINSDGQLNRKENTIYFENVNTRKPIPIEKIYSLYIFGSVTVSSQALRLFSMENVPIHFFSRNDYYSGSFYPRKSKVSGDVLVNQADHYNNDKKRLLLARKFVEGACKNICRNLSRYDRREEKEAIENNMEELGDVKRITEVMNVEGRCRKIYYRAFDKILPEKFEFSERRKRPPNNMANALISFGNSLMYGSALTEIYKTQLDPSISYLHEPSARRYSLSLDLADLFKPIVVDRAIFYLTNKGKLTEDDFREDLNKCLLNDEGRKKFLERYDDTMKRTKKHRDLGRKVSYRRLVRLECYKLVKHVLGEKEYEPFVIWW
ncbi:CRISPR-associated protein Cas1 [candidate division MSBL1 archaeon SCGC-AAA259E17]|uniref:CRISPR-associated endonuclease Cas1 n=1 Tax=candidate division MSBL1 archaeon SCGC-AAA259E17 TaxID=1698263 RepID=A0A133UGV8_9EURY|nr:CRISPR-associated protein Cas1 [candidate division MSBL1 archaeon SCGC-AAA259E17]